MVIRPFEMTPRMSYLTSAHCAPAAAHGGTVPMIRRWESFRPYPSH